MDRANMSEPSAFTKVLRSFRCAGAGVAHTLRTQRNAQIETFVAACVLIAAAVLKVERWEWVVLILTIGLVLAMEILNTAVESAINFLSPDQHQWAKWAKDAAAGAVLIVAIAAVGVGVVIFLPHLIRR
jgi:diacylglycerol kinase (ATP)